jgi:hypothetical protein
MMVNNVHSKKSRVDSTRSVVGFVCRRCVSIRSTRKRVESTRMRVESTRMCVESTRLRVDRIDTHLRHTNPTALRVESTRDFLLCSILSSILENF